MRRSGGKRAADVNSLGFFTAELGAERLTVRDKISEVRYGNIGVNDPLGEEIMVDVRVRWGGRGGEMKVFKGSETFDGGGSVLAGMKVMLEKLEEFLDRGAHFNRRRLKHAGKSRRAREPGDRDTGRDTANRRRDRSRAWQALEGGIKLVAVRGHRGGPGRKGRRERRGRGGGSGEVGDRRSAGRDKASGRGKDGRLGERGSRRKAERSTGRGTRCGKADP